MAPEPYAGYIAQIKTPDSSTYLLKDSELRSEFSDHESNTTIHTTESEKATWNAKSDFSGDYEDLDNKPQVNNITLIGNKTLDQLNIQVKGNYADSALTNFEIDALLNND